MQITIDLSDKFYFLQDIEELKQQIKINLALMFYKQEKISIGKASELAEMDIYDFMKECAKNKIPVINQTKEELKIEFDQLKKEFL